MNKFSKESPRLRSNNSNMLWWVSVLLCVTLPSTTLAYQSSHPQQQQQQQQQPFGSNALPRVKNRARHSRKNSLLGLPLPARSQGDAKRWHPTSWRLFARRSNTVQPDEQQQVTSTDGDEPLLSELDARVLQSMLQDQDKLDLDQEENMRKLLERGIGPKTAPPPKQETKDDSDDGNSEYSSQVFKKLTDTKLWKVLIRTAEDVVESAKIFVMNRIERDAQLLASVGLFAWDRAVRDVARALPAASATARRAVGQLSNSSSFDADERPVDLFDTLNTPLDEIKSVTQAITEILSGEVTMVDSSSSGVRRRLRSLAPAGQGNNAERQRRAYERRKKTTLKEEKEVIPNIGKVVGGFADVTWEMKREMEVESSQPGYKTEDLRNAIEAGATQTGRLLQAVKDEGWASALLSPLKQQKLERQLKAQQEKSPNGQAMNIPVDLLQNMMEERSRVTSRLNKCIEQPEATWLGLEVIQRATNVHFDEANLRAVVESMIQARDELKTKAKDKKSNKNNAMQQLLSALEELRQVKTTILSIQAKACDLISPVVGDALYNELVGKTSGGSEPILSSLDELEAATKRSATQREPEPNMVLGPSKAGSTIAPTNAATNSRKFMDVVPEERVHSRRNFWQADDDEEESAFASSHAELVTDDVFGKTTNPTTTKTVEAVAEDIPQGEEEPNLLIQLSLRSLDIVFFVLEKVLLVAVPKLFRVGTTMSVRIDEVGRSGLGRKGWQRIGFTEEGARRY